MTTPREQIEDIFKFRTYAGHEVVVDALVDLLEAECERARGEERESGEKGEGTWKGKKIKNMSRLEIIEAWEQTDLLYRASLTHTKL